MHNINIHRQFIIALMVLLNARVSFTLKLKQMLWILAYLLLFSFHDLAGQPSHAFQTIHAINPQTSETKLLETNSGKKFAKFRSS